MEEGSDVRTTTPLFTNEALPPAQYLKDLVPINNYIVNQLRLQQVVADNQLKIGRSAYVPNTILFGKRILYVDGLNKHLSPRTMAGVGSTWNIFDDSNQEKTVRQVKIASQSLRLDKEKAIMGLGVSIDKFYSQLQNALDNVEALDTTIEMSQELIRVRKRSFQGGMTTSTEVVSAEAILAEVKTVFSLVYYQYNMASVNLLSVCDTPEQSHQYKMEGKTEELPGN